MLLTHLIFFRFFTGAKTSDAPAPEPAPTTAPGVRHTRFLRRGPKLPWDREDEEKPQDEVVVAKPKKRRIKLPEFEVAREAVSPQVPVQTSIAIEAPKIVLPDIGTLTIDDDTDDALLLSI